MATIKTSMSCTVRCTLWLCFRCLSTGKDGTIAFETISFHPLAKHHSTFGKRLNSSKAPCSHWASQFIIHTICYSCLRAVTAHGPRWSAGLVTTFAFMRYAGGRSGGILIEDSATCITFTSFQIWNDVIVAYLHRWWWWWWFCQAVGELQGVTPWPLGNTCGCPRNLGGRINNNNCSYFVQWSVTLHLTLEWYVLWFNPEKTQRNPWISAACAKLNINTFYLLTATAVKGWICTVLKYPCESVKMVKKKIIFETVRHQTEILIRTTRQWKRLFFCFVFLLLFVECDSPCFLAEAPLWGWQTSSTVSESCETHKCLASTRRVCFHRWLWSAAVGQRRLQQQDGSVLTQKTGAFSTWNMALPRLKWEAPPRSSTLCAPDGAELLREDRSLIETPKPRQPNFPGRDFSFLEGWQPIV